MEIQDEKTSKIQKKERFLKLKNLLKSTQKSEKGITLIALVITIVVLLILARNFDKYAFSVIILYSKKQQNLK